MRTITERFVVALTATAQSDDRTPRKIIFVPVAIVEVDFPLNPQ
jgi:hypothetical protein